MLYFLDANTGEMLSIVDSNVYETAESQCHSPIDNFRFDNQRIYCLGLAFDSKDGRVISSLTFDGVAKQWFPLIVSDTMYLNTFSGSLIALDLTGFNEKWKYTAYSHNQPISIISNVAVVGSTGYAIANDATLHAFDLITGNEIGWWRAPAVVDWQLKPGRYSPIAGVESDGKRLYASFGTNTLYAFGP
jgi:outer membrane protein assembly factor BamB